MMNNKMIIPETQKNNLSYSPLHLERMPEGQVRLVLNMDNPVQARLCENGQQRHCEGDSPKQSSESQDSGLLHCVRNDGKWNFSHSLKRSATRGKYDFYAMELRRSSMFFYMFFFFLLFVVHIQKSYYLCRNNFKT
jgi:hypothetical protein